MEVVAAAFCICDFTYNTPFHILINTYAEEFTEVVDAASLVFCELHNIAPAPALISLL